MLIMSVDFLNEIEAAEMDVSKLEIDRDSGESRGVKPAALSEEELDVLEQEYIESELEETGLRGNATGDITMVDSDLKVLFNAWHNGEKEGDDRGGVRSGEESPVSGFISVNPEISRCIRDCRRRLGMTQSTLADKVSALLRGTDGDSQERAVSVLTVSRLERGAITRVHAQLLQGIETVLGMERQTLLSMETIPVVPAGMADGMPAGGGRPFYDAPTPPSSPGGNLGVTGIDASEIRFCFNCGSKLIVAGANFCQACGTKMPTVIK